MLQQLVNEARFTLQIKAEGPLLVRSGHATIIGPDMTPVLTYRGGEWQVYLPGSSLKGVLRSHLEKVCRTLRSGVVCNPFVQLKDRVQLANGRATCPDYHDVACSDKFEARQKGQVQVGNQKVRFDRSEGQLRNPVVYADSCPICRLFGSNSYIGRVSIGDAYLRDTRRPRPTEVRDGVGIDRLTGGAARGAKFELEVVSPETSFETEIVARNFEVWQLGLLLLAVQDVRDGMLRIGSGRSRGLGAVSGAVEEVQVTQFGRASQAAAGLVRGLGAFLAGQPERYGAFSDDRLQVEPAPEVKRNGIREVSHFTGASLAALQTAAVEEMVRRLEAWQAPQRMTFAYLQSNAR